MADFVQTPLNYAVDYARTLANAYPYYHIFQSYGQDQTMKNINQ